MRVYVDDLLSAGPRALNDKVIEALKIIWKTSQPKHLGSDPDCVPVLRFLGMNLERDNAERSAELELPEGSSLVTQMEYIVEILMTFEPSLQPSLQLKIQVTGSEQAEYLASPQALVQDEIVEINAAQKNQKLHYNSEHECDQSTCNRWLLELDSFES